MSSDFDFAWKKFSEALKKQVKIDREQENFIETLKTSTSSQLLQQRQDRLKEKIDDKIDDIDYKIKGKIDYYTQQIKNTKNRTELKISQLESKIKILESKTETEVDEIEVKIKTYVEKNKAVVDAIISNAETQKKKITKEMESLSESNEQYQTSLYDEIDKLLEKKTKLQERLERQKDQTIIPTTLAEEKKIVKLEIVKDSAKKDVDDASLKFIQATQDDANARRQDAIQQQREQEEKERTRLINEREQFMQEKRARDQLEEQQRQEKRQENQKHISNIMAQKKCSYDEAQYIFVYGKEKPKSSEESEPSIKEEPKAFNQEDKFDDVIDFLENDCNTKKEREKYLSKLKWLNLSESPQWFQTRIQSILEKEDSESEPEPEPEPEPKKSKEESKSDMSPFENLVIDFMTDKSTPLQERQQYLQDLIAKKKVKHPTVIKYLDPSLLISKAQPTQQFPTIIGNSKVKK